ncbi:MAG: mycofactocin-coupled SDR family oxidoreductase [Chloroflexales bacterium]|nr:mycofactocin-coupled SDR family oxidoreductase [Chloroflexales bacterium]
MTKLDGKVAFITGAARGQGRAHALTLARAGADIAALDICRDLPYPRYGLASRADLDETVGQVRALGRRALALVADVRSAGEIEAAVRETIGALGRIDILICNAGIADMATTWDVTEEWWDIMLDVNLKGYWLAAKYVVPQMLAQQSGGRIIMTSSVAGLKGMPGLSHYCAAKWGVVGLARSLAIEVAEHGITVNTIHPTGVDTALITGMAQAAGIPKEQLVAQLRQDNLLPVQLIEAQDIANAALWLVSDEARYVTGLELKVDAGQMLK